MARQRNAILSDPDGADLSVLEFLAVGRTLGALLWRAVKGGVSHLKLDISEIFKVRQSLFL